MADVGIGQTATASIQLFSKKLNDAVTDNHPVTQAMEENGGIVEVDGGRTVLDEALSGQNTTVDWVGETGQIPLTNQNVMDSPEFNWFYQLCSITMGLAEMYKNSGVSKKHDILAAKLDAAEASTMNEFHEGVLSSGTGSGGLQIGGLALLISTTPTTGTVGGIDRSSANAAWFRNQKFDTAGDWSDGAVDAGNVKRFLDKGVNATTIMSKSQVQIGLLGQTHWEFLTSALQAHQQIVNENKTGHIGFQKLVYRDVPMYLSGGLNYSGATVQTATRTYLLNVKRGGVNIVFHEKARFAMLPKVDSADQAAFSRLLFTMATMRVGAYAKQCWVGFD